MTKSDPWQSLWSATAQEGPILGPPPSDSECEFAIIGGGVEGLALARELALQGREVALFEADTIGAGATGASAGVLAPQLVRQTPASICKALGQDAGGRYLRLLASAGRATWDVVGDRVAEVGGTAHGYLAPAVGQGGKRKVEDLAAEWKAFRQDLTVIEGPELTRLTGSTAYAAALHDPTGGSLNPLAFARLLANDALASGARLFTHSRASALKRDAGVWQFRVGATTARARKVVLCANGGNAALHPLLARSILPLQVCQVATMPLPAALREVILPGRHSLTDMETEVFSIRYDPDGRLITAHPMGSDLLDRERLEKIINQRLSSMLPAYVYTPLEYGWVGTAWLTSNLMPQLTTVEEGLFAIQACNGRGIALAAAIGRTVAEWLTSDGVQPCGLPVLPPRRISGYFLARYAPQIMMKMALATRNFRKAFAKPFTGAHQ